MNHSFIPTVQVSSRSSGGRKDSLEMQELSTYAPKQAADAPLGVLEVSR